MDSAFMTNDVILGLGSEFGTFWVEILVQLSYIIAEILCAMIVLAGLVDVM